jgi:DNA-binding beta-propeller fold protein YncE
MRSVRIAGFALAALMLGNAPVHRAHLRIGSFGLHTGAGPLISGSRVLVEATGLQGTFSLSLVGPGRIEGHDYIAPSVDRPQTATLVASSSGTVAYGTVTIVPPPAPRRALIAVASYDDGIALHDARSFALLGYAGIGGPAGDVAFGKNGDIFAADTDGDILTAIKRNPWTVQRIAGVSEGNEIAVDARSGNVFVSDRDAGPTGALTRITPEGDVMLVRTGNTAEGLTIDEARQLVYVGNVNEQSVAVVDARTMRLLRKLPSVNRTFGVALDPRRQRLYVVSNSSPGMNGKGGYVAEIDAGRVPRIVRRSAYFTFPLGIAFDAQHRRLFVTDEAKDMVYVLRDDTLAAARAPIRTCGTPWRPHITGGLLFVPCAHDNRIDVLSLRTLRRVAGAPFATGGFPLSVASWP